MATLRVTQVVIEALMAFDDCIQSWIADVPAGTEAGDLMIAVLSPNDQAAQPVLLPGWDELFPAVGDLSVAPLATAVHYKIAGLAESDTLEFQQDVDGVVSQFKGTILVVSFRSVDQSTPINTSAVSFELDPSGEYVAPSIVPTLPRCSLVVIVTQAEEGNTFTPPAGYTEIADNGFIAIAANMDLTNPASATGTKTGTKTDATAGYNAYHIAINGSM